MKQLVHSIEKTGYRLGVRVTFEYSRPYSDPPLEAGVLLRELTERKKEAALYLAERDLHPTHTRTAELYMSEITHGVQCARSPYELLLLAIRCISEMTGDTLFYTQNAGDIKAVYGAGLLEPVPLNVELTEVRQRLKNLERAELSAWPEVVKGRVSRAVKAHRKYEARLMGALEQ